MTIAFENVLYLSGASGATTKRTPADRLTDILNVKDFGAKGDGMTDDTVAIQACFNSAFNQPGGNGQANAELNTPVFFPRGVYNVSSQHTTTVTGTNNVGGVIQLVVTSTAAFSNDDRVQVSGVLGTTNANGSWYITVDSPSLMTLKLSSFNSGWSAGGTQAVKSSALHVNHTWGTRIFGAGKLASRISCQTSFAQTINFNGLAYSTVDNLGFSSATGGVGCDYGWSGIGAGAQEVVFFSNTFSGGDIGLLIGSGGSMTSENLILGCACGGAVNGIQIDNQNSLANSVIGGNIAGCATGIRVDGGAMGVIHGVGFQGNTISDIGIYSSSNDNYHIAACRSESVNFAIIHAGPAAVLSACSQLNATTGVFLFYEAGSVGTCVVDSCASQSGTITGNGSLYINGGAFPSGFLSAFAGTLTQYNIPPIPISSLLTPAPGLAGLRMAVTNSTVAAAGNFGAIVAGVGSNIVPVYCDGTNWRIG